MRVYSSKKGMIIEASRKLFYEKGYDETNFDEIAKECAITKSLISYHFKSKYELARSVMNEYLLELKNTVAIKSYAMANVTDVQVATAVEMYVLEMMYKTDEKANRFYMQIPIENFSKENAATDKMRYEAHDRQVKLDVDRGADEISMIALCAHSALHTLHCAYYNSVFNCTFEEYLMYNIKLPYVLMNVQKDRIQEILTEMKKITSKLDFEIMPYFNIK